MAQARVQRSSGEWSSIVARWRSSGLSAAKFAAQQGIGESSLHKWARRIPVGASATDAFDEVQVADAKAGVSTGAARVEITTRNGYMIRVGDGVSVEVLRSVLKAVAIC